MQGLTGYNLNIVAEVFSGKAYPLQLLNLLDACPLIVDLGANIGSFSLACKALRKDIRLAVVEPDPENFAALKANLAGTSAEFYQAALSDRDGQTTLFLGEQDAVTNSTFPGKMVSEQRGIAVQCLDTQRFLEDLVRRLGKISLLKSDTEGGEWHLLGLAPNFLAVIPLICIEYHSSSFVEQFLPTMLKSHVIYAGSVRFPHRGEVSMLRKDLVPGEQASFEIGSPK